MAEAISVAVRTAAIDVAAVLAGLTRERRDIGAVVSFTGFVRNDNGLVALTLEHYPAMTERALADIAAQAAARWPLAGGAIVHRVGRMIPGEAIVVVAVMSPHRSAAFQAAEFLMDWLKTKAPFWKAEERPGGTTWVAARDSDDAAAARWNVPER